MTLLRLITWPYVRRHLLRSVLTTAGIVLGVALLVAMRTSNESVLRAFSDTVNSVAGKAQLQVSAGDVGIPEEVLEQIQNIPIVSAAAPVVESVVDTGVAGYGKLLVLAVDMTGDRSLRTYDFENAEDAVLDDPLVFLAQPDSLIVTEEYARKTGLESGDRITLDTMEGHKQFTVRGILKSGGMTSAFGGNLAIMDIYAAQNVFGRGRRFDRIDIGLREGVTVEEGERAIRDVIGSGLTVEPPASRGRQFEALLSVYATAVNVSSLFALVIAMFIIYNSFTIAVTQRRSEIGILRALGAPRSQIRNLFLLESAVAGLIGSTLGLAAGLAFTRSVTGLTAQMLEGILGIPQNADEVLADPVFLAFAVVLGVVTSMIAALIPARSAAVIEPVRALQKGKYQVISAGESRPRRIAALVTGAAALLCFAFSAYRAVFYLGYLLIVVTSLLLSPFLCLALAKLVRVPLRRLRPVEGALAADSLIQAPRRTSATVAALMLSVALVVGTAGVARSSFRSIQTWMDTNLNPDFFVSPSETLGRNFRFPESLAPEIQAVSGVAEVQRVRTARIQFRGGPVMLIGAEMEKIGRRVPEMVVEGDPGTMYRLTAEEKGIVVSENLAILAGLRIGSEVELPSPDGVLGLPVVGVIRDYSNQLGSLYLDWDVYTRRFHDDTVDAFRVYLEPGASAAEVRERILERVGSGRRLFVLTNKEVRDYVTELTNQWFGMTYLQILVAALVAVLGIINTLTVSISDRRREFGVLRAVGGLRNQIRRTVWIEAATIGFIGLTLGIAIGAVQLYYELEAIKNDLAGFPLPYEFPLAMVAALFPLILIAALGAAIGPAEAAVRGALVEALEYE